MDWWCGIGKSTKDNWDFDSAPKSEPRERDRRNRDIRPCMLTN